MFISSLLISANSIIHAHVKMRSPHEVLLRREPESCRRGFLLFFEHGRFFIAPCHGIMTGNIHYQYQHYPVWSGLGEYRECYLSTRAKFAGQVEVERNRSSVPRLSFTNLGVVPLELFSNHHEFLEMYGLSGIVNRHSMVHWSKTR